MSEKVKTALVVADRREAIRELTSGAAHFAETVFLAYIGSREDAVNAHKAYRLGDESASFVNCVDSIAELVKQVNADIVICAPNRNGSLAAAVVAARHGVSVLSDCTSLKIADGKVIGTRMVFGGTAVKTECSKSGFAVVCPSEGSFEAEVAVPVEAVEDVSASNRVELVEKRSKETRSRSISAAKNVVGVGRGIGSEENIVLAQALAKAIDGEVGCTRPVAEEYKWLPSEVNVGISGATIRPNLYIACGISGQIQHMVGINESRVIAAINKDENAPIFSSCDIGIVGNAALIIPELIKKIEQS